MADLDAHSRSPAGIAAIYGAVSAVYILVSDRIVAATVSDPTLATQIQTAKGWAFVAVSSILIFGLVYRSQKSLESTNDRLDRALQQTSVLHRILRHNLRNSCNVIAGNTELLETYVRGDGGTPAAPEQTDASSTPDGTDGETDESSPADPTDGETDESSPADPTDGETDESSTADPTDGETTVSSPADATDGQPDEPAASRSTQRDTEACLARIRNQTEQLVTITEKTRKLRDIVLDPERAEGVDLVAVVQARVAGAQDQYPQATIETDLPESLVVPTDPRIGVAIGELIENAVEHSDRDAPRVEISLRGADGGAVLEIADDGPGMPDMERSVLEEGMETQTFHSEGLGLWIARTVVVHADGEISIADNEPRGTVVRIVLG